MVVGGGGRVGVGGGWVVGCKPWREIIPPSMAAPVCSGFDVARWAVNHSTKLSVRGL